MKNVRLQSIVRISAQGVSRPYVRQDNAGNHFHEVRAVKEYICGVVPIYVRPQPVTDETACAGVVVRCPENGFSDCRLIGEGDPALNRVANFFPRFGRENLLRTLEWSRHDIGFSRSRGRRGMSNGVSPISSAPAKTASNTVRRKSAPRSHSVHPVRKYEHRGDEKRCEYCDSSSYDVGRIRSPTRKHEK